MRIKIPQKLVVKGENALKDFWHKTKQEVSETKQAEKIFIRYVEGQPISPGEKDAMKQQSLDILKIIFIGVPLAILPGFSIVMIVLVKLSQKYNFNIFPSAFSKKS